MIGGSCLCGATAWTAEGPPSPMSHCHCSFCRKQHGSPFVTWFTVPGAGFTWTARAALRRYESSPGYVRCFCGTCGAKVPGPQPDGQVFVPAGSVDGDPGVRPEAHIFAGSRAPWLPGIEDDLPVFDAYPPETGLPELETPAPAEPAAPGVVRGSCLCGDVRLRLEGPASFCNTCHCSRCRKARGAAWATNLGYPVRALTFTAGEDALATYPVPDARFFTHTFCARCGSSLPRADRARGIAIVPIGCLDDDPGLLPERHIQVGSKAPWADVPGDLPRFEEGPPAR